MTPLHNKVIVERIPGETVTSSGIVLQRSNEVDRAKVIAIGPQVDEVSVGDIVLLDWNKAVKAGDNYILTVDNIVLIYGE
jgi:co-chaperonin GroES (HSP10)